MKHWTDSDFENWLYGLKEPDGHTSECEECRTEMTRLTAVRQRVVAPVEVSSDFLAAQRRNIYRRLGAPMRNWAPVRWALSAAMLLVVMFSLSVPLRKQQTAAAPSDEQLFKDLASIEQTAEPRAIQPIHKLFEE